MTPRSSLLTLLVRARGAGGFSGGLGAGGGVGRARSLFLGNRRLLGVVAVAVGRGGRRRRGLRSGRRRGRSLGRRLVGRRFSGGGGASGHHGDRFVGVAALAGAVHAADDVVIGLAGLHVGVGPGQLGEVHRDDEPGILRARRAADRVARGADRGIPREQHVGVG